MIRLCSNRLSLDVDRVEALTDDDDRGMFPALSSVP